jgi:hypothetical protein
MALLLIKTIFIFVRGGALFVAAINAGSVILAKISHLNAAVGLGVFLNAISPMKRIAIMNIEVCVEKFRSSCSSNKSKFRSIGTVRLRSRSSRHIAPVTARIVATTNALRIIFLIKYRYDWRQYYQNGGLVDRQAPEVLSNGGLEG